MHPGPDPSRCLSRAAVRELDRRAIEECGVPSIVLMENAGRAVAEEALRMLAGRPGETLVLTGPGNNGGDGLVVARTLENRGRRARVVFVGAHERLSDGPQDFLINLDLWRRQGGRLSVAVAPAELAHLLGELRAAPLAVDALFGTGLARPLEGPYLAAVASLNACGAPVLAVDVPSGLDADTGRELGLAVRAQATVTFAAMKPGLLRELGPACAGRVTVAEIGIPRFLLEQALGEEQEG
jgi:NAD(P)H-hydrate epimerase